MVKITGYNMSIEYLKKKMMKNTEPIPITFYGNTSED